MNKFIKKNLILFVFTFTSSIFSQTTVQVISTSINSTSVANCGTINFGTSLSNSLAFTINLNNSSMPSGNLRIRLKNNCNSTFEGVEKNVVSISSSQWTNGFLSLPISCTVSADEVLVSGSCLLIEFKSNSNIVNISCIFPITKAPPAPTFTASPSTITIPCGDVSAKTFTVNAANIPSGSNVTYQWGTGFGWLGSVSNQNSITLTPLYPTSLPSSVSVTPYINGVAKSTVYFNVVRGIVPNGSISGNPVVCSSSSFSYIGLLPGQTVTWSLSNNTAGILSTTSGTSTIFTLVNLVSVNLIATVLNTCGTTFTKSVSIISGGPQMSGTVYGPTCVAFGQRVTYY